MKKNILVPFDGSQNAGEALKMAITLAKALNEKIILLNVQPQFNHANVKRYFRENEIEAYQKDLFAETIASAEELLKESGIGYETRLRLGDPKVQICEEAVLCEECEQDSAKDGVSMIVMGSRGVNPLLSGLMGSVSYYVVNAGICPVLIVPMEEIPETKRDYDVIMPPF